MEGNVNVDEFKESLDNMSIELDRLEHKIDKWTSDIFETATEDDETFNSLILHVLTDENDVIAHCRKLNNIFSDDPSTITINDADSITEEDVISDKTNRIDDHINANNIVTSTVSLEIEYENDAQRFNENITSESKSAIHQEIIHNEFNDTVSPMPESDQTHHEETFLQGESNVALKYYNLSETVIQNDNKSILPVNQHNRSTDYNDNKDATNRNMVELFNENDTPPKFNSTDNQTDCEKFKINPFNLPPGENYTSNDNSNIDRGGTIAQPSNILYESSDKNVKRTENDISSRHESQSADFIAGIRDSENVIEHNMFSVPNNYEENKEKFGNDIKKHSYIENNILSMRTVVDYKSHPEKIQGNASYIQPDHHCDDYDDVLLLHDDNGIIGGDTPAYQVPTVTHELALEYITSDQDTKFDLHTMAKNRPTDSILETREQENVVNENNSSILNKNDTLHDEFNIYNELRNDSNKGNIENTTPDESYDDGDVLELDDHDSSLFDDMGGIETPVHYTDVAAKTGKHNRKNTYHVNIDSVIRRADSTTSSVAKENTDITKSISSNNIPLEKQPADIPHIGDDIIFESLKMITSPISDVDDLNDYPADEESNDRRKHVMKYIEDARTNNDLVPSKGNYTKIKVFDPYCFFYLTTGCKKSQCRFLHEFPTTEKIKGKLIKYNFEVFIQEYKLMREWPCLRRKYGLCYVEECLRRHLTKELIFMAVDFIKKSNKTSEVDSHLNKLVVEAVLNYYNEVDLCEEQLMTKVSTGMYLCDLLIEAIADAEHFPRFVSAFRKLALFFNKVGRPISVLYATKILEKVCDMTYESTLARALIRILRVTSSRIFSNPSMQKFQKIATKDVKLHEEFMSLKKNMTSDYFVCTEEYPNKNIDQVSSTSQHSANHMKSQDNAKPSIKPTDKTISINNLCKPRAFASRDSRTQLSTSTPGVTQEPGLTKTPASVHSINFHKSVKALQKRRKSVKINPWTKPSNLQLDENPNRATEDSILNK